MTAKQHNNKILCHLNKTAAELVRAVRTTPMTPRVLNVLLGSALSAVVSAPAFAELPSPATKWIRSGRFADPAPQVIGNTMNINQLSQRGILHWDTFNIGRDNVVNFNQPDTTSSTLNRVIGDSVDPSRILGQLNATGQVMIVNQNGIVFGNGAQVNVRGLVASTLDVNDEVFENTGVMDALQENQAAFEARRLSVDENGDLVIADIGVAQDEATRIIIEDGAVLRALGGEENGRIMIFAPTIENHGDIEAEDGQALLAASRDKVYLARLDDDTPAILVEVATGGQVSNLGRIIAERGDVTLMGLAVNQEGVARATTAVNVNGSIHLLARDGAQTRGARGRFEVNASRAGKLTLGEDSLTEVALELDSGVTAIDGQPHSPSEVQLQGGEIVFEKNASLVASNGEVRVEAVIDPSQSAIEKNGSRIVMESGASIDVSGTDQAVKSVADNIIEVELRGNQLADAPLQKVGPLRNKTVLVDVRKGTDLANIDAELSQIERPLSERAASGGRVRLDSEGDILVKEGASIDVSGGRVTYVGEALSTTWLVTRDRRLVNINDARPDVEYRGIFGQHVVEHKKWGITERFGSANGGGFASFEPGYIEGKDAGTLELVARNIVYDGELRAQSIAGRHQRLASSAVDSLIRPYDQLPLGGRLVVGDASALANERKDFSLGDVIFADRSPAIGLDLTETLPADTPFTLSPQRLLADGVNRLEVYSNRRIGIDNETQLAFTPDGALTLVSGEIDFNGAFSSAGGQVTFRALATREVDIDTPPRVTVGSGAEVDVSGGWVNDRVDITGGTLETPAVIDGGVIDLTSDGDLLLSRGSRLTANGGAHLNSNRDLEAGQGGDIRVATTGDDSRELGLGAHFSAYAFEQGGTLSIGASGFRLTDSLSPAQLPGEQVLTPDFFSTGGFSRFSLGSTHTGIYLADGVSVHPRQSNLQLSGLAFERQPSGADLGSFTTLLERPTFERNPVDLSLSLKRNQLVYGIDAHIALGENSRLATDPGGRVSIRSDSDLLVFGDIDTPAGSIDLTLNKETINGFDPSKALWIGAGSRLTARGAVKAQTDALGRLQGEVLDGGVISLSAESGFLVTESTSLLDVSGTAADLSIDAKSLGGATAGSRVERITGAAGEINLQAADGVILDGALSGQAAATPGAAAGRLQVAVDTSRRDDDNTNVSGLRFPEGPRVLEIGSSLQPRLAGRRPGESLLSGAEVRQLEGGQFQEVAAVGQLSVAQIEQGGFDDVALLARWSAANQGQGAQIRFVGDVDLTTRRSLTLDAPLLTADQTAHIVLDSAYLVVGSSPGTIDFHADNVPAAGTATLALSAETLDIRGDLSLDGFASARFDSRGDIRLTGLRSSSLQELDISGSLRTAGDLTFVAGQLYPTTLTGFTIAAEGDNTLVRFERNGNEPAKPLSAGGSLMVEAPRIEQAGVLRAPFGRIELNATQAVDDSGDAVTALVLATDSETSVSGNGLLVPFGETELDGQDWVLPYVEGIRKVFVVNPDAEAEAAPPAKQVQLQAPAVALEEGAVIDLSGGGDLLALEFKPGQGGSFDILDSANQAGAFAILPRLDSQYAPLDPLAGEGFAYRPGDTLMVNGGDDLPVGEYAILPARYALLPGAFLVTPQAGSRDIQPGQTFVRSDGIPVVAAKFAAAGSGVEQGRWSGFSLESRAQWSQRAEYREARAGEIFARQAADTGIASPQLPADAGALQLVAQTGLRLQGRLQAAAGSDAAGGSGRSASVDIVGDSLSVVTALSGRDDRVELLASDLNAFGAQSLLLGGTRRNSADGQVLDVGAAQVSVDGNVSLTAPEILLAAKDAVTLEAGVQLRAEGDEVVGARRLNLTGNGALLRVSTGEQVAIDREAAPGNSGDLQVKAGAQLYAQRSMVIEASGEQAVDGTLELGESGSLNLGASRISLGETADVTEGIAFDNQSLQTLDVAELVLTSRSTVDLLGDVQFGRVDDRPGLNSLVIHAAGIRGSDSSGVSELSADTITLANVNRDVVPADGATGSGELILNAGRQLTVGDQRLTAPGDSLPDFAIQGFDKVTLAGAEVVAQGDTAFKVDGDLSIDTGRIATAGGVTADFVADGRLETLAREAGNLSSVKALGGRLRFSAENIVHRGAVELPSGQVTFSAKSGDVLLAEGAAIDVSGRNQLFADLVTNTPAGRIALVSQQGDVILSAGSLLDVSGAPAGGAAGRLSIEAGNGHARLQGTLRAQAGDGEARGGFNLDVASLDDDDTVTGNDFSALNQLLNEAGFDGERTLRVRADSDIRIAASDVVRSQAFTLTADRGAITLDGTIDARGARAGEVTLNADDDLTINQSAVIDASAHGTDQAGGKVVLRSANGRIEFTSGDGVAASQVNVAGTDADGAARANGQVRLVANRTATGVAIGALAVDIDGADSIRVEAHDRQLVADDSVLAGRLDAAQNYVASNTALSDLGVAADARFHLVPSVELFSDTDFTVSNGLDLSGWRFNGEAPVVTLRATGDLAFTASLEDGFSQGSDFLGNSFDVLGNGPASSYQLIAGGNINSPNPFVVDNPGDILIGDSVKVRTGVGDIRLAAGRDVVLQGRDSVVYTAGENAGPGTLDEFFVDFQLKGDVAHNGGDLVLSAARDIVTAGTDQLITDWQARYGRPSDSFEPRTTWTVMFDQFAQGVGALGGGYIDIEAGRDIRDLSVSVATSGQQIGATADDNRVRVLGGGDFRVDAGRDIRGGIFYAGNGEGNLQAGGRIAQGANGLDPVFALGYAHIEAIAGNGLGVATSLNPTMLPQSAAQGDGFSNFDSYFFTYQPETGLMFERTPVASGLSLRALSGDVNLENDTSAVFSAYNKRAGTGLATIYPASLEVGALTGNVILGRSLILYPDAGGRLRLLADGNITDNPAQISTGVSLVVSDQDPILTPRVLRPIDVAGDDGDVTNGHASTPLHQADAEAARIVARNGDVAGLKSRTPLKFQIPKQLLLRAGRDITGLNLDIQHNRPSDSSLILTGRDLVYATQRGNENGGLTNSTAQGITIAGPGALQVVAGRNIDLGTSRGLISSGDTANLALPESGASISVITGFDGANDNGDFTRLPDFVDLSDFYFDPQNEPVPVDAVSRDLADEGVLTFAERQKMFEPRLQPVRDEIVGHMRALTGDAGLDADSALAAYIALQTYQRNALAYVRAAGDTQMLSDSEALARFELLPLQQRNQSILATLFSEVRQGGNAGAVGAGYERANSAIDALFNPAAAAGGELRLLVSQITTLDGGDINIVSPYGGVNAGIASTDQLSKPSDELGIIVRGRGDINTVVRDNLQVNATRVFTLDGGDIMVWSSLGDIDAGSGENPDTSVATRDVQFDKHGNALITFPPTVSTAGIRAIVSDAQTPPGDVFLFAPQGIIDAGDAGIGTAGNLTLAATQVVGADNIDVGGVSVGAPTAPAGPPPGLAGVSALAASVTKNAQESAAGVGEDAAEQEAELALLSVDVLSFGEDNEQ